MSRNYSQFLPSIFFLYQNGWIRAYRGIEIEAFGVNPYLSLPFVNLDSEPRIHC